MAKRLTAVFVANALLMVDTNDSVEISNRCSSSICSISK